MTYSNDLRIRALNSYYHEELPIKQICNIFCISRKTFYNWRKEAKIYNSFEKPTIKRKSKKSKYKNDIVEYVKRYTINRDNFRINNLICYIKKKFNVRLNKNNIYYILKKSNITYKKAYHKVVKNKKDYKKKIKQLIKNIKSIGTNKIISIDECHFEINMKPNRGWSFKGNRTIFTKKSGKRTRLTLICAINEQKIIHYVLHAGKVDALFYKDFLKSINIKCKKKTLLMDNARTHHAKIVKTYMKNKSNKILYNVPYSPETNPIEQVFSKIKNIVKKDNNETITKLTRSINNAFNNITINDLSNYFKHSFNNQKVI